MKRVITILLASVTTAAVTYLLVFAHFTGEFPWDDTVSEDQVLLTINSKILGQEREIMVYLPHDYDSSQQYPVMYVLDGTSQHQLVVKALETLSPTGKVPAAIVVGVPSHESREKDYTPPYLRQDNDDINSAPGEGDKFLSFMEVELIPLIEKNYSATKDRLLIGHSRGGLLVMHSLITHTTLFQSRFCFSAPFWRQDELIIKKVDDFLSAADTLDNFIYISVGDQETDNMKKGFESMKKLFEQKSPEKFRWRNSITKNADHQNNAARSVADAIWEWSGKW
jgi:predicted alpha/beta superfamily hydrolase